MTSMADVPAYMLPGAPILQPAHLEGLSDPALSTEILPGPPSLLSVQQASTRRDPKKPGSFLSYLPTSDPGTTYSGLMAGTSMTSNVDGPRRKRARLNKGTAASRAQRASARNLNSSLAPPEPAVLEDGVPQLSLAPDSDFDPLSIPFDSDPPTASRANSAPAFEEPTTSASVVANGRAKSSRRDKGKGKEVDKGAQLKVKEEPAGTTSLSPDPSVGQVNEDHCSACRSLGSLVYCDGCPRAFHLWCLDPPMEAGECPDGERWFCPGCTNRKNPPSKPPPSFMSPLIHQVQNSLPREYQLPDDIRSFFKDVTTGPKGTYVDSSEVKPPRLNRLGQLEDRDPYRLKDRNGMPALCFRCGSSALPPNNMGTGPPIPKRPRRSTSRAHSSEVWRSIIPCDYCSLHWHLDCLDPPLTSMPPFGKKWMCPNHADQILQPKRRIPKSAIAPLDITKSNQVNNGNIEVVPDDNEPPSDKPTLDEILINGRRYRVPEKVILLDFWNKLSQIRHPERRAEPPESAMSSPLTSLSSLDEELPQATESFTSNDLDIAQMLCSLTKPRRRVVPNDQASASTSRILVDTGTQTEAEPAHHHVLRSRGTKRKIGSFPGNALEQASVDESTPSARHRQSARTKKAKVNVKQEPEDQVLAANKSADHDANQQSNRPARQRRRVKPTEKMKDYNASNLANSLDDDIDTPATSVNVAIPSTSTSAAPVSTKATVAPPATPKPTALVSQTGHSATPVLKIRLPRLSAIAQSSSNQSAPAPSTTDQPNTPAQSEGRPRRSTRRQDSLPLSVGAVSGLTSDTGDDAYLPKVSRNKRHRKKSGRAE